MGFDKTKVIRAAEKFLSQGKIPAAIKEYEKIVDEDPDDFTALNMLGDLYSRAGDNKEAVKCFSLIAEHYREQGFNLKAIAMYKKMDRLNPGGVEMAAKLAPLYEAQGLVVEARAHYLTLAESYTRSNQTQKTLEILRKIADLDPNNVDVRLKLASGYLHEGFKREAATAFIQAGAQLAGRKQFERALDAYSKALEIVPNDREALGGLVTSHMSLGSADEAAEVLERALSRQPDDVELLSMLTYAYTEAGDAASAERATIALVEREPTSYTRFIEVAKLYQKANDTDSAVRIISNLAEQMLAGGEETQLMGLLNEALARNPEHIDALRLLFRINTWQQDEEGMRSALERMAEAAQAAGLEDEERRALTHLVRLGPYDERHSERLEELGGQLEEPVEDEPIRAEPAREDVPTFESFMLTNERHAPGAVSEDQPPPAGAHSASDAEFEWNSAAPPAASAPSSSDPSASFADLNDWADTSASKEASAPIFSNEQPGEEQPSAGFHEFDFGGPAAQAAPGGAETASELPKDREAVLKQELESVDFYIAQGYAEIAFDTLNMIERQFGAHPEIEARRAKLKEAEAAAQQTAGATQSAEPPVETSEGVEFSGFARYDVADEAKTSSSVDEVDAAFMSLGDQAQTAQQQQPPAQSEKQGIDPGLAAVFDEFRTAVEDEETTPTDGDYETHYNLGLAYKEMDLLDEAVEEFQMAAGMVTPQDGTPRYLQCCNLLGHCFMQKEMPRLAAMWFKKGLDAPGHSEDEYQALRYELGAAYESMGDIDKAIDVFTEVYGINVGYRGVADKLRELQQKTKEQGSDVRG